MRLKGSDGRRVLDADLDEYAMDAFLSNWARWARGMPAFVGAHTMQWPATVSEEIADPQTVLPVDVDAAQSAEVVLLSMRKRRPKLWRAVRYRYLARWADVTAARQMRITRHEYRALLLRAYSWIDSRLGGA